MLYLFLLDQPDKRLVRQRRELILEMPQRQIVHPAEQVDSLAERSLSVDAVPYTAIASPFLILTAPILYRSSALVLSPATFSPTLPITCSRAPFSSPGSAEYKSILKELVDVYETFNPGFETTFSNLPVVALIHKLRWDLGSRLTEMDAISLLRNLWYRIKLIKIMDTTFEELRLGTFDVAKFNFDTWFYDVSRDEAKLDLYNMAYNAIKQMDHFLPPRSARESVFPYLTPTQYLAATMTDKATPLGQDYDGNEAPLSQYQILLWCVRLQKLEHLSTEGFVELS